RIACALSPCGRLPFERSSKLHTSFTPGRCRPRTSERVGNSLDTSLGSAPHEATLHTNDLRIARQPSGDASVYVHLLTLVGFGWYAYVERSAAPLTARAATTAATTAATSSAPHQDRTPFARSVAVRIAWGSRGTSRSWRMPPQTSNRCPKAHPA